MWLVDSEPAAHNSYRYLQYLASTRLQHLERVRTFSSRRLNLSTKLSQDEKEIFSRSLSYIDQAELEATAIQSFADGLSCVSLCPAFRNAITGISLMSVKQLYALLAHASILPDHYSTFPYSSASLRYALRMRPFVPLSIPEVPSYTDFQALASLPPESHSSKTPVNQDAKSLREVNLHAKNLVDNAVIAFKNARKEWDAISKSSPAQARTTQCEEWWRADIKNVQRACIAANITIETVRKVVGALESGVSVQELKKALKVEMSEHGKEYHSWWIVPKITILS